MIIGPPGCGKNKVAKYLAQKQKRGQVSLRDLLEWNRGRGPEGAVLCQNIEDSLVAKAAELEEVLVERDKVVKKLKGEKLDEWLEENPLDESQYKVPGDEQIIELLLNRLAHPDCNAGAVFNNIYNDKLWLTPKKLMDLLLKAIPDQKVHVISLIGRVDEDGLP